MHLTWWDSEICGAMERKSRECGYEISVVTHPNRRTCPHRVDAGSSIRQSDAWNQACMHASHGSPRLFARPPPGRQRTSTTEVALAATALLCARDYHTNLYMSHTLVLLCDRAQQLGRGQPARTLTTHNSRPTAGHDRACRFTPARRLEVLRADSCAMSSHPALPFTFVSTKPTFLSACSYAQTPS
ncbi:hypothetical protein IE81DRAFT_54968 [Ceraceosorus guamensis]|uniref:Uncharacterized protein n=1 Tax=Ceraceosorus guamensis TaxID=1522189 RepID=A0A316W2Q5_9BASI|nr:hypothetical protein IE81DRAFT_54968 [Ceraceosorus guamensis]PWN43979.1 hypothetical protein IE81DRAFT_54968 [Ceraceosorus guamensis]